MLDGAPRPQELQRAINYQNWGLHDYEQLPAGVFPGMSVALNLYNLFREQQRAASNGQLAKWSQQNPDRADLWARLFEEHRKQKKERQHGT